MKDFVPKPYKKEAVTIRFDDSTLRRLEDIAARYGMSRNELVVQCVHALRELPDAASDSDTIG